MGFDVREMRESFSEEQITAEELQNCLEPGSHVQ